MHARIPIPRAGSWSGVPRVSSLITIGYLDMTDHLHMTGVNMLAIFGNPGMLGKQSGKRLFQPDSGLWKQLRSITWQPSCPAKTNILPNMFSIRYDLPVYQHPPPYPTVYSEYQAGEPKSMRRPLSSSYIDIKTILIAEAYNIVKSYAIK